jgi:hypothetical protein
MNERLKKRSPCHNQKKIKKKNFRKMGEYPPSPYLGTVCARHSVKLNTPLR